MGRQDFSRWQDDESGWEGESQRQEGPRPFADHSDAGLRSDEHVLRDILEALAEDEAIRSGEIDIVVRDGEVSLSGTVADRATRKHAEICAASVAGVRDVINQLRIEFSPEVQDQERRE
jgi:osmotically-inducible protein OsmY